MNCKATYLSDSETPFVMSITFFTVNVLSLVSKNALWVWSTLRLAN